MQNNLRIFAVHSCEKRSAFFVKMEVEHLYADFEQLTNRIFYNLLYIIGFYPDQDFLAHHSMFFFSNPRKKK